MDGRIQRKLNEFLQDSFGVRDIDTITTAGTVKHLAETTTQTNTLLANLAISTDGHGSTQIAVAAHHDCAGNPVNDETQKQQVSRAVRFLGDLNPDAEVIGLFLDSNWDVETIER